MKRRKGDQHRSRVDTSEGEELTSNPFAGLAPLRDRLEEKPADESERMRWDLPTQPSSAAEDPVPARAVVRYQRKGRGGKEVTLVEQLELCPEELDRWLVELKRALGCGGIREGEDTLVLQGDQRERLPSLLESRGVSRVSVS